MVNKFVAPEPGPMVVMFMGAVSKVFGMPEEGVLGLKEALHSQGWLAKEHEHPMALAKVATSAAIHHYVPDGAPASIDHVSPGKAVAEHRPPVEYQKNDVPRRG